MWRRRRELPRNSSLSILLAEPLFCNKASNRFPGTPSHRQRKDPGLTTIQLTPPKRYPPPDAYQPAKVHQISPMTALRCTFSAGKSGVIRTNCVQDMPDNRPDRRAPSPGNRPVYERRHQFSRRPFPLVNHTLGVLQSEHPLRLFCRLSSGTAR